MVRLRSGAKTRESDPLPESLKHSVEVNDTKSSKRAKASVIYDATSDSKHNVDEGKQKSKKKVPSINHDDLHVNGKQVEENEGAGESTRRSAKGRKAKAEPDSTSETVDASKFQNGKHDHDASKGQSEGSLGTREVTVHRCSFADLIPQSIAALAGQGKTLALGRDSGLVEIWQRQGSALQPVFSAPGKRSQGLRTLVWHKDRLFGGNLDGTLFEVDFEKRCQHVTDGSGGGGVWDMDSSSNLIASVSENGKVRLYEPKNGSFGLDLVRTLSGSVHGRLLSVRFHGNQPDEFLFTGGMDAHIRKWSIKQRRVVDQISIPTLSRSLSIWTLDTKDDAIACGDSLGRVHIWMKSENGLLQTFSEHRSDIRSVKFSNDGKSLFASGIDSRVAAFRFVQEKWVYVYSHRAHTHDVRAIAIVDSEADELICSAGVDAQLITYPVRSFERSRPWKNSPFPQRICAKVAECSGSKSDDRIILVAHSFKLDLWLLNLKACSETHLAEISLQEEVELRCHDMTRDGRLIATADDIHGIRLFRVDWTLAMKSQWQAPVSIEKILISGLNSIAQQSFRAVAFDGAQKYLTVGTTQEIVFIDLEMFAVEKIVPVSQGSITALAASLDGQWLAAAVSKGGVQMPESVELFHIESMQSHAVIPGTYFGSNHAALAFSRDSRELLIARTDESIRSFRVDKGLKEEWCQRLAPGLTDKIINLTVNPSTASSILAWTWSTLAAVPIHSEHSEVRCLRKFKPLIHAEFVKPDELLVIEAPFVQALKHLPDVLEAPKFGT